jgi:hypothetical protein
MRRFLGPAGLPVPVTRATAPVALRKPWDSNPHAVDPLPVFETGPSSSRMASRSNRESWLDDTVRTKHVRAILKDCGQVRVPQPLVTREPGLSILMAESWVVDPIDLRLPAWPPGRNPAEADSRAQRGQPETACGDGRRARTVRGTSGCSLRVTRRRSCGD